MSFPAETYGPVIAELLSEPRLPPLGPGKPDAALKRRLDVPTLFAHTTVRDANLAACCVAGVYLLYDHLDESHRISQDLGNQSGSYWHGLMHRREPDFWNSKYWFRQVGRHPVFAGLGAEAVRVADGSLSLAKDWDPFGFVDLCEKSLGRDDEREMACRRVQLREWEMLFAWCYDQAIGE
jgi:hypothetical protein